MGTKALVAVGAVAAIGGALWLALRVPELPPIPSGADESAVAGSQAPRAQQRPAAAGGAAATPGDASRPRFVIAAPPPTLFNEYLGAKQYRILYDRLAHSAEGHTADGKLVLYEILRQCATVTEGMRPGFRSNPPKREDFLKTLAPGDPQREKRIEAYEAYAHDRCAGFEGMTVKHADLMKLLDDAAATGDPKARALALEQELWQARRRGQGGISDTQVDIVRALATSKDPEAIRVAGRIMANSWNDYALRVGPDQLPVEQRAFVNAFLVLACEYGAPCGTDTPRMQQACALQGHCAAQSYPDYLYYYGSTPHDASMLMQYRDLVRRAIESGDWSQINVVRGVPPGNNRMTFVPGPR